MAGPVPGRTILAAGTLALDSVETDSGSVAGVPGGSALYFAAGAAHPQGPGSGSNARIAIVGVAGSDFPMDECRWLEDRGVDLTGIQRVEGPSFRWSVRYHGEERETLATNRGVTLGRIPTVPERLRSPWAVFLGSTHPDTQGAVLNCLEGDPLVVLDTMSHWISDERPALEALLARAHILLVNQEEADLLGGPEVLLERGPAWVVVKRGGAGAVAYGPAMELTVPAAPVARVIDPTGAGDAFAGGLLASLGRGPIEGGPEAAVGRGAAVGHDAMHRALAAGAVAGALAVSAFGLDAFWGRATQLGISPVPGPEP